MSASEKAIGRRCREARVAAEIKQAEMARLVGITATRLFDYEKGRSPLPYWIGAIIAEKADACQRWLFSGALPMNPCIRVDETVERAVPKTALFSQVYDALLAKEIDHLFRSVAAVESKREADLEAPHFIEWAAIWAPAPTQVMHVLIGRLRKLEGIASNLTESDLLKLDAEVQRVLERAAKRRDRERRASTWAEGLEFERTGTAAHLREQLNAFLNAHLKIAKREAAQQTTPAARRERAPAGKK